MSQEKPESSDFTPFTFIAAAGNEVVVTDEWVEAGGALSEATVIDKVTDEAHKFVLVETDEEGTVMRWLRRINETFYIETDIYAPMDYVPDDEDEFWEEFDETVDNAEIELVMAIGMFPRYKLEAEWMDQSRQNYLNKLQSMVDDADPETVEVHRHNLFGTSKAF